MFLARAFKSVLGSSVINDTRYTQVCYARFRFIPRKRQGEWLFKVNRTGYDKKDQEITKENLGFIEQKIYQDYGEPVVHKGVTTYKDSSLLKVPPLEPTEWKFGMKRTGLIGKKIGHYPLWTKEGKKINTTVLQIVDNHVIKYTPPEDFNPTQRKPLKNYKKEGCLLIGAEAANPNNLTGNFLGLFKGSGVPPKKRISRMLIHPNGALPAGTPLNATHFRVGDYVDVRGMTIDRGFQGVMKRWGFKGGPATHGVTKTHRRGGSLSSGIKHRIWKGKKMPGHMGNQVSINKGLKIWRINTRTNTLWVSGYSVPGLINSWVYIYDTCLPLKQPKEPYHMPTFLGDESQLPEDIYEPSIHRFEDPTIFYEPEK